YIDAPSNDAGSRFLVSIVAIARTTTDPLAREDGSDIVLGGFNFEFFTDDNPDHTGDTMLSDNLNVGPGVNGPITVPAEQPGSVWDQALATWDKREYPDQ